MTLLRLMIAALSCVPACAHAGDLDIKVVDGVGRPVPEAVVSVRPAGGIPPGPIQFPWAATMTQQNISFSPHVLIVPVGAKVQFPNRDKVRHHVYSFSKPAKFEIKLFGKDETRSQVFAKPGTVALGCNIHDQMSGFIKVVDTPYAAKSNAAGQARIARLPTGTAQVTVWHPLMKGKDNQIVMTVPIPASGVVTKVVPVALRAM